MGRGVYTERIPPSEINKIFLSLFYEEKKTKQ